jgi:AcrR family transcriptional regulator
MGRSEITLQRLRDALERLKNGEPTKTKRDGKISILRINDEAGLSRGAIYHYTEFIEEAKAEIAFHEQRRLENKDRDILESFKEESSRIDQIKHAKQNETRLKNTYREQRDNLKAISDEIVKRDVSWAYRCLELQMELARYEGNRVVSFLPEDKNQV